MGNSSNIKGLAGAVRLKALDAAALAKMEKHGKREDETSLRRKVNDDEALVFGGLDLVDRQREHVEGRKQQGKTKALHAIVQFPSKLMPNTERGQKAMLRHAVKFINERYGGEAVFAARLDRDEKGTHKVDVFFLPRWQHRYKSGKTQDRCGIGTFAKDEAKRRYVKQKVFDEKAGKEVWKVFPRTKDDTRPAADDSRTQGAALQDCLYEYLRKGLPDVVRGQKKASVAPDWVQPEALGLAKDRERFELEKMAKEEENREERKRVVLADRALERKRAEIEETAREKDRELNKKAAIILSAQRASGKQTDPELEKMVAAAKKRRKGRER